MHEVPKRLEEEVATQDCLVEGLLQMMLGVMKNVQGKTPVRKKEDKQRQAELQRKYQRPDRMASITLWKRKAGAGSALDAQSSPQLILDGK
eukprot:4209642-Heterocapsa_arctica.AAC.1